MLSPQLLRELLVYDPTSGECTWRSRAVHHFKDERYAARWNQRFAGKRAGGSDGNGYRTIAIFRHSYKLHRLAFLYMLGEWPPFQVDHVNHVRTDNRWENLRAVTHATNSRNITMRRDNTSGTNGVNYDRKRNRWRASAMCDGRQYHLGRFLTKDEAKAARQQFDTHHNYHPNHGTHPAEQAK